jgi:hypothetical protein
LPHRYLKHQAAAADLSGISAGDVAPPFWFATQDSGSEEQDQLELAAAGQAKNQETCIIGAISFLQRKPAPNSSKDTADQQQQQQQAGLGSPASCFMRLLLKKEVATVASIAAAAAGRPGGGPRRALQCVVDMWPALPHADFLTILDEAVAAPAAAAAAEQLKVHVPAAAAAGATQQLDFKQQQHLVGEAASAAPTATAMKTEQLQLPDPSSSAAAIQPKFELFIAAVKAEQPPAAVKAAPEVQAASGTIALPNAAAAAAAAAASGGGRRRARAAAGKRDDDFEYDLAGEEDELLSLASAAAASGGKSKRRCGDGFGRGGVPETMQANRLKLKVSCL